MKEPMLATEEPSLPGDDYGSGLLAACLETMEAPVLLVDEQGLVVFAGKRAGEVVGKQPDLLIGQNWADCGRGSAAMARRLLPSHAGTHSGVKAGKRPCAAWI